MCYSAGSIEQACPMCRLFPQRRCPHTRDTCRNRSAHPRMDVLFLTNAEVETFNGCGYCKWANLDPTPPAKALGYNNEGWPGCCRPPHQSDHHLIPPEDWQAVSTVHRVTIPPQIEALLKIHPLSAGVVSLASPTSRSASSKPASPPSGRKNTRGSPSSKPSVLSNKVMNTPSPSRGRSPHSSSSSASVSRTPSSHAVSSSVPSSSSMDTIRRKTPSGNTDRRLEGTHSSHSSPSRRSVDLENPNSPKRVSSVRRPALTPATTSVSVSKIVAADNRSPTTSQDGPAKRRASVSGAASQSSPSQTPRIPDRSAFVTPRSPKKDQDCGASTSSGSSDGFGSVSDSTVTSDGGFTDYLSDESEAELQRQAEAKAAIMAQSQAEEYEFKMARQQLAHIGLRPPIKLWNPTNSTTPTKLTI